MIRLAIVATPAALPDLRPAPGALDSDVVRSRFSLPDAAFRLVELDPAVDLAEQLEIFFEKNPLPKETQALFYGSSPVVLSVEEELFLCLDPMNPDTGDSIRDIAWVLRERVPGPVAIVLECRYEDEPNLPSRAAMIVSAARSAVLSVPAPGVELLVAARPLTNTQEDRPSPLTRALIEALDEADPKEGLSLQRFFATCDVADGSTMSAACVEHVSAQKSFLLFPKADSPKVDKAADYVRTTLSTDVDPTEGDRSFDEGEAFSAVGDDEPTETSAEFDSELAFVGRLPFESGAEDSARRSRPPPPRSPLNAALEFSNTATEGTRLTDVGSISGSITSAEMEIDADDGDTSTSMAFSEQVALGDALVSAKDPEGALEAFRRALGQLGTGAAAARASVYFRIAELKYRQDKRREAILYLEKVLELVPTDKAALVALIELHVAEDDFRAVQSAEERLLSVIRDPGERFERLVEFGERWQQRKDGAPRSRRSYERAHDIRPDDRGVLEKLCTLYEAMSAVDETISTRRKLAELTSDPRSRAEHYFELGSYALEIGRVVTALELFDTALATDPSMLEPLALLAQLLTERGEWRALEQAYRRMLDRAPRIAETAIRAEVTWKIQRLLGTLYRDHLDETAHALDSFESALAARPGDLEGHLVASELARTLGRYDRAAMHLQAVAALDPARVETFHELFELFQKLRRPDQAFLAASITTYLRKADSREQFLFEENRAEGMTKLVRPLAASAWEWLRVAERDRNLEAVLASIAPAAISARLSQLAGEGRMPVLDPEARQDPQRATLSVVRSFTWASHFLGVPVPAIYLHDDPNVALAAIIAKEPTVLVGGRVVRGRTLSELAFLVARHLGYYVGPHRLLLYYPSLEELTTCFLAALKIALPDLPMPQQARAAVFDLAAHIEPHLEPTRREELERAVHTFEAARVLADIEGWVASVDRCVTRAGYLLAGDLELVADILESEPRGVVTVEGKIADLMGFAVSDELYALRKQLGIAIEP